MTITYATVFNDIVKDLDSFFIDGYSSNIITNFNVPGTFIARSKGSGKERELQMPGFTANAEIKDVNRFIAAHLIAGHEIAHLINDHNLPVDKSDKDSVALEKWADYFGARISYTVLNFGKLSSAQLKSYAGPYANANAVPFEKWSMLLLNGTHDAIDFFFQQWPSAGTRVHPPASFRVQSVVGGIMSFFKKYYNEINEEITLYTIKALLLTQPWFKSIANEIAETDVGDEQFWHIGKMHERIQAERFEITAGLHPFFERLIGTSYRLSPDDIKWRAELIAKSFDSWKSPLGKSAAAVARSL